MGYFSNFRPMPPKCALKILSENVHDNQQGEQFLEKSHGSAVSNPGLMLDETYISHSLHGN